MKVLANNACVSDSCPADYVGPVVVYAVAMNGPDEGPFLLHCVAENHAAGMILLANCDSGDWPGISAGIRPATEKDRA